MCVMYRSNLASRRWITCVRQETRVLIDQYPDGSPAEAAQQLPNRSNILAQLGGWLVAGAQPGDVLVFVFAGHGCQVRLPGGELEDALVPTDAAQGVDS